MMSSCAYVGGGIKSLDDIRDLLNAGCDKVSINTTAVKDPYFISKAANASAAMYCRCNRCKAHRRQHGGCHRRAVGNRRVLWPMWFFRSRSKGPSWAISTHGGRKMKLINAIAWAKKIEALGAGEIC